MATTHKDTDSRDRVEEDEIDLIALMAQVWKGRGLILKVCSAFLIVGAAYSFLASSTSYEASSVFIIQTANPPSPSLGGLAALAGLNAGSSAGGSGISPALYPQVIYSKPFKRDMLDVVLRYQGDTITYRDYLLQKPTPTLSKIKKYTIGLPNLFIQWITPNKKKPALDNGQNGLKISSQEYSLMNSIEGTVSIENSSGGSLTLLVKDAVPEVAAQLALWVEKDLQRKIINYKVRNTREILELTTRLFLEKQEELYLLQDSLAKFTEQNFNINSAYVQNQKLRLETRYNMVNKVYSELATQKEQAALQLKKDTPIFSIIDPVTIPNEKNSASNGLIVIISVMLGFLLSIAILLIEEPLKALRKAIKKNSSNVN